MNNFFINIFTDSTIKSTTNNFREMGADAKTTTILSCSKETIVMSENNLEKLKEVTHNEELKKLKEIGSKTPILPSEIGTDFNYKREIVLWNCFGFALLHLIGFIGIFMFFNGSTDIRTTIYCEYP